MVIWVSFRRKREFYYFSEVQPRRRIWACKNDGTPPVQCVQVRAHAWRRHVNDIISLDSLFATIDLEWETDEGDVKKMRCHFVFPFHGDTRDFDFEISISLGIPDILAWL